MSRASSYALATPAERPGHAHPFGTCDLGSRKVVQGFQSQQDEDDLMEVDDMIERVEELVL
jgi:hypothetical protein